MARLHDRRLLHRLGQGEAGALLRHALSRPVRARLRQAHARLWHYEGATRNFARGKIGAAMPTRARTDVLEAHSITFEPKCAPASSVVAFSVGKPGVHFSGKCS